MGQKLANGHVDLDLSSFPLVCMTEHGMLSNAERVEMMEALDELVDKRGRHAVMLDLSKAHPMPDAQRTFVAESLHMCAEVTAQKWAAVGVVVREPMLSNLATGAFWVRVSPVPTKVFTSKEETGAWLRMCLTKTSSSAIDISQIRASSKRRTS